MKHSEIKDKIIETASDLFYRQGYNLTGINEIIKEAGIAKATLYSHFSTKSELCVAYLQTKNEAFLNDLDAYAKTRPVGKDRVLSIFSFLQEFFATPYFNGCWCVNTVSELPAKDIIIREEVQTQKKKFLKLITNLIAENLDIQDDRQEALAQQVYLLYEGAIAESNLHKQEWPIATAKSLCAQIL